MLELYSNIKKRRLELNMTQQELAEQIGYTSGKSMIAKIEKGDVDLTQSKIKQFADALHTTPSSLMGWEMVDLFAGDITIECKGVKNERVHERLKALYDSYYNQIRPYILKMNDAKREQLLTYAKFLSEQEDTDGKI